MKLPFGLEISRQKSLRTLSSVSNHWNWWSPFGIHEPWTGAWQANAPEVDRTEGLVGFAAVYSCLTAIAGDIAKCGLKLTRKNRGIWEEITDPHGNGFDSKVINLLQAPNHYQNTIEYVEQFIISKLLKGNTYVLKQRDRDGNVVALYIMDANRVTVLQADNSDVYYELQTDVLSQVDNTVTVPAKEIIHDRMPGLWHPLVGTSPLYACGMSVTMGNKIQANSTGLFGNRSVPGGILTAPHAISNDIAARLKEKWESNFSGSNVGRLAVLGDGMKYEPITMTATDAQLIEQLRWAVEDVARAFHFPLYKLTGQLPPYANSVDALTTMYYKDCLQPLIEKFEKCMNEGLSLESGTSVEVDLDTLLRMDTSELFDTNNKSQRFMTVNEQRRRANLPPIEGGDTVYLQEQDHSLDALADRDDGPDPFGAKKPTQPSSSNPPSPPSVPEKALDSEDSEYFMAELRKALAPA